MVTFADLLQEIASFRLICFVSVTNSFLIAFFVLLQAKRNFVGSHDKSPPLLLILSNLTHFLFVELLRTQKVPVSPKGLGVSLTSPIVHYSAIDDMQYTV